MKTPDLKILKMGHHKTYGLQGLPGRLPEHETIRGSKE